MKIGYTLQIIGLLSEKGALPGLTRGEIRDALGLPLDVEVTARIREAATPTYGAFKIRCMRISATEWRYWLGSKERARARAFFASKVRTRLKRAA